MALRVCDRDGVRYAVGLSGCPQCGAPEAKSHEQTEADDMPKINRVDNVTYREAELAETEGPWSKDQDGTDSRPSSESGERSESEPSTSSRSSARETENPSDRTGEGGSSARSTAGDRTPDGAAGGVDSTRASKTTSPSKATGTAANVSGRGASRPQGGSR